MFHGAIEILGMFLVYYYCNCYWIW